MWKRKLLILVKVFLLMTMLASATQTNSDAGKTIKTLTPVRMKIYLQHKQ